MHRVIFSQRHGRRYHQEAVQSTLLLSALLCSALLCSVLLSSAQRSSAQLSSVPLICTSGDGTAIEDGPRSLPIESGPCGLSLPIATCMYKVSPGESAGVHWSPSLLPPTTTIVGSVDGYKGCLLLHIIKRMSWESVAGKNYGLENVDC
jgi:hypothetical protein